MAQTSPMSLIYDVLVVVMEHQACAGSMLDLRTLMQTCRILRHEGVKHLLRGSVVLRNDESIRSFARYVLSYDHADFRSLNHHLVLCTGPILEPTARVLTHVARNITHLRSLEIRDADIVLASDDLLFTALTHLTCLRHLTLTATNGIDAYPICEEFLTWLDARLQSAAIRLPSVRQLAGDREYGCRPIRILVNSLSTLHELEIANLDWLLFDRRFFNSFPAVRRLMLHCGRYPPVSDFSVIFPNVEFLTLRCTPPVDYIRRLRNIPRTCASVKGWRALKTLQGSARDLCWARLGLPMQALHVTSIDDGDDIAYLAHILSWAMPSHLVLEADAQIFATDLRVQFVGMLNRLEAVDAVSHLELVVFVTDEGFNSDVDYFFMRIVWTFKRMALTSLEVKFVMSCAASTFDNAHPREGAAAAVKPGFHPVIAKAFASFARTCAGYFQDYVRGLWPTITFMHVQSIPCGCPVAKVA